MLPHLVEVQPYFGRGVGEGQARRVGGLLRAAPALVAALGGCYGWGQYQLGVLTGGLEGNTGGGRTTEVQGALTVLSPQAGGNRESSNSLGLGGTAEGPQPGRRPREVREARGELGAGNLPRPQLHRSAMGGWAHHPHNTGSCCPPSAAAGSCRWLCKCYNRQLLQVV